MSKDKSGSGKFILGAAIGGAIGAIAGILSAPKSGKETRADIAKKAGEVKETADKKVEQGKEVAKSWKVKILDRGKDDEDDKAPEKPEKPEKPAKAKAKAKQSKK